MPYKYGFEVELFISKGGCICFEKPRLLEMKPYFFWIVIGDLVEGQGGAEGVTHAGGNRQQGSSALNVENLLPLLFNLLLLYYIIGHTD